MSTSHRKNYCSCSYCCSDPCCCSIQGPRGFRGPVGPPGPPGSGSTLFFTEEQGSRIIIPFAVPTQIMDVKVTTTEFNQRVKLDATITTMVNVGVSSTSFAYGVTYQLLRNTTLLTSTPQMGSYSKQDIIVNGYTWHPNFTFVDIPGPPGVYVYRVIAEDTSARSSSVATIEARNLGFTATVYPPSS